MRRIDCRQSRNYHFIAASRAINDCIAVLGIALDVLTAIRASEFDVAHLEDAAISTGAPGAASCGLRG